MTQTNKEFNALYKSFNSKITRYISSKINNREDAQELVEDVFIKITQKIHLFDESKSQLQTWVYNIAKNVLIDHFRKKKLITVTINTTMEDDAEYAEEIELPDGGMNPLEALIQKDAAAMIMDKFSEFNSLEKKLMTMYAVQGMSYNDIVDELDMPLGTVKATIHRARTFMRESFPQHVNLL
jgi:RNA polymerase sigma factor (sigma-70 family)